MAVKTPRETYPGEGKQKFRGEHLMQWVGEGFPITDVAR